MSTPELRRALASEIDRLDAEIEIAERYSAGAEAQAGRQESASSVR